MNYEQLKNSILQEAIEGRLVPQNPSEEPAAVLLRRIREEKARLVKEKKIKKDKNESIIYRNADGHWMERFEDKKRPEVCIDEEVPFEIPEGWEWCRLSEITFNHGQKKPDVKFSYIDIGSINNKRQKLNKEENLLAPEKAPSRARKIVKEGDIIYSTVRPYLHNMAIIDKDFSCEPIASTGFAVLACINGIFNKYLFYYLMSPSFDQYANDGNNAKGIAYPAINDEKLYKALVPLPPLSEQHRIVSRIESIMPKVEEYGKAQERLDALNAKLPKDLKNSILQEAIEGRLVPQNPSDEPAAVLLQRIREEKARLVKEKKIKKDKNESIIYRNADGHWMERFEDKKRGEVCIDEEIPFEIPESWEWTRIGNVFDHNTGKALNGGKGPGKSMTYITTSNLYWNRFDLDNLKSMNFTDTEVDKCTVRKGDLLVCEGGDYGRAAIWNYDFDIRIQNHIHRLRPFLPLSIKYIYYIFNLYKSIGVIAGKGIAIQGLSSGALHRILFPLPPLSEQHRIVAKLESLLPRVERLVAS